MKIAYVTTYDPSSILNWSGAGRNMAKTLEEKGHDLTYISELYEERKLLLNIKKAFYKYAKGEVFYRDRQPSVIRSFARQIDKKLVGMAPDVLFSPGSIPIAQLDNDAPIVFWTDSSFHGMVDYYPEFTNLCAETLNNGHSSEHKALKNCSLAIYASQWAADVAIDYYDVDPSKVKVVPFGANLNTKKSINEVKDLISAKEQGTCEILFIGVDWVRKGGELAMAVTEMLNKSGIPTRLTIIGCDVPKVVEDSPFTESLGFIDKDSSDGSSTITDRLIRSHFLMVPSIAECFGIVHCEANSFGIPAIGRQTGGVGEVIKNGVNGMTFHTEATAEAYCAFIEGYFKDQKKYRDLALSSYNEYATRLNWNAAGDRINDHLKELLG